MARPPTWRREAELAVVVPPPVRRYFEVTIHGMRYRFETLREARKALREARRRA